MMLSQKYNFTLKKRIKVNITKQVTTVMRIFLVRDIKNSSETCKWYLGFIAFSL